MKIECTQEEFRRLSSFSCPIQNCNAVNNKTCAECWKEHVEIKIVEEVKDDKDIEMDQ